MCLLRKNLACLFESTHFREIFHLYLNRCLFLKEIMNQERRQTKQQKAAFAK